jgi:glycosyltransferase involved in cell wall biosynthesis
VVTGEYPPAIGGVADYTALLAANLAVTGSRVTVVTGPERTSSGTPPPARREGDDGQDQPDADGSVEIRRVSGWDRRAADEIARIVHEVRADVVHLQYQAAAFDMSGAVNALPLLLRARGVRSQFVTTFHDLRVPYLFPKAGPLRRLAVHMLLGASAGAIFTDPSDLARAHPLRDAVWIPMAPTIAVEAPPMKETARAALGIDADNLVLAHFGFLNASKGLHTLIRATERVLRAGVPVRLLFVGDETGASDPTNAAVADGVWAHAETLGIGDLVIRTGHGGGREVSAALAAADMAVLPFTDGASLRRSSLLACWAHGLPVVTTQPRRWSSLAAAHTVPSFADPGTYRVDGRVAVLVEPGDDAALARAIYRLADEPDRMRELGERGQGLVARLTWPAVAGATVAFYRRLLHAR